MNSATTSLTNADAARTSTRTRALLGATSGLLAAAVAVGVGELVAALTEPATSPLVVVGGTFIDLTPEWLKSFAIATFGDQDKLALLGGIVATLAIVAAGLGALATRDLRLGIAGIVLFGGVGSAAALTRPGATPADVLPTLLGTAAALVALVLLIRAIVPGAAMTVESQRADPVDPGVIRLASGEPATRRSFLALSAGTLAIAAGSMAAARLVTGRPSSGASIALPRPVSPVGAIPSGAELGIDGLSPYLTPTDRFYRVDTALVIPSVDVNGWRLRIRGLVDRPMELTYAELLARPLVERVITLTCVSNQVGGKYAGTATWLGVPLRDLLAEAGVQPGADQIVSRSVDGMSIGTPTTVAMDGRDAMIAVGMNGVPLPPVHGFPARMLVPGLYGYVSATKWLTEIELTTFDAFDPYWVARGWAPEAPIKTMSRIDTPKPLSTVAAGRIAIAGVAWAQHRGVERVEVRIDGGAWQEARLAAVDTIDTWRQWVLAWDATPGRHLLEVRATDATGATQLEERAEPFPDGATGWHSIVMTVA